MRHADIHQMRGPRAARGLDRRENRRQIDRWNSAAFDGEGCGVPTRCTIVSAGVTTGANVDASSALPMTAVAPAAIRPIDPGRASARTRWPRATSALDQTLPDVAGRAGNKNVARNGSDGPLRDMKRRRRPSRAILIFAAAPVRRRSPPMRSFAAAADSASARAPRRRRISTAASISAASSFVTRSKATAEAGASTIRARTSISRSGCPSSPRRMSAKDQSGEPKHLLVRLTDTALFDCPFVMMTEPGGAGFDTEEAANLRLYLEKGGFLWADDFWGDTRGAGGSASCERRCRHPNFPSSTCRPTIRCSTRNSRSRRSPRFPRSISFLAQAVRPSAAPTAPPRMRAASPTRRAG